MAPGEVKSSSYRQILKSSVFIGGSQVITILIGIVKNKILAILLGPYGMGVLGVYTTLGTLLSSVFNFGLGSSGVKQVSETYKEDSYGKYLFIVKRIRQILLLAGSIAALLMIVFSEQLGKLSFGSDYKNAYAIGIAILAGYVLFENLSTGERAILQGTRKLKELAKGQIIGSIIGAILSTVSIYFLRENGVALFLVLTSCCTYLVLKKFNRTEFKANTSEVTKAFRKEESRKLISLGLAFVTTTLAGAAVAYIIRIIIVDIEGLEGAGIYQASLALVNMSFNIVLMAMGTDFYPRLITVAQDNKLIKRTVNEQVEIALLITLPILLTVFALAPIIVQVIYTDSFNSGIGLIRWLAASCFLRVLCWPLGYIFIAKGANKHYVITSLFWEAIHIPLIFFFTRMAGFTGIGISYIVDYLLVLIGSSLLAYKYYKFNWSKEVIFSFTFSVIMTACAAFCLFLDLNNWIYYPLVLIILVLTLYRSIYLLQKRMGLNLKQLLSKRNK